MKWDYYDWLPIALLFFSIFFTWLSCGKAGNMKDDTGNEVLDYYIRTTNACLHFSIWFLGAFYFVTLLSILSTIIVIYLTTFVEFRSVGKIFLYSVISLFCTILNFVINLRDISTTYREGFIRYLCVVLQLCDKLKHSSSDGLDFSYLYRINFEVEEMLKNVIR